MIYECLLCFLSSSSIFYLVLAHLFIFIFSPPAMLKEEAMLIKGRLNKDDLSSFTTLNSWLEKFKLVQEICERRITDKVDNIP